jgi:hypothetical protein
LEHQGKLSPAANFHGGRGRSHTRNAPLPSLTGRTALNKAHLRTKKTPPKGSSSDPRAAFVVTHQDVTQNCSAPRGSILCRAEQTRGCDRRPGSIPRQRRLAISPLAPNSQPQASAATGEEARASGPNFIAMSCPELWRSWGTCPETDWLAAHVGRPRARYGVAP